MKIDIEIIASVSIKRKKPWPKLSWLGEEMESLCLLDNHRASILALPSGKTKRKIPKLHQLLPDTVELNCSRNGHYLIGLLKSGEVFVWSKDKGAVKYIHGVTKFKDSLVTDSTRPYIFISNDIDNVALILDSGIFIWQSNQDLPQNVFVEKKTDISGCWHSVMLENNIQLPSDMSKEKYITCGFAENQVLGSFAVICWCFYQEDKLILSSALLRWKSFHDVRPFIVKWNTIIIPQKLQPIRSRGSLLSSMSHGCHVLAFVANQRVASATKLMFISPFSNTVVDVDLDRCGFHLSKKGRSYWIASMEWTHDDTFLALVTKRGAFFMVSRLGQPIYLQTTGCSIEMGPALALPLHPVITIHGHSNHIHPKQNSEQSPTSTISEIDVQRQRFSVAVHPRHAIVLCSDGYLVTIMQLPSNQTDQSLMKELILSANRLSLEVKAQEGLAITLQGETTLKQALETKEIKRQTGMQRKMKENSPARNKSTLKRLRFEEFNETMNDTLGSQMSSTGLHIGIEEGVIVFGETLDQEVDKADVNPLDEIRKSLLSTWGLLVSTNHQWSHSLENIAVHCTKGLCKLIQHVISLNNSNDQSNTVLHSVLNTYGKVIAMLNFDVFSQKALVPCIKFVNLVIGKLLAKTKTDIGIYQLKHLQCCYMLLKFTARILTGLSWLCDSQCGNGEVFDLVEPGMVTKFSQTDELSVTSNGQTQPSSKTQILGAKTPAQKLAKSWKKLYRQTSSYRSMVLKNKSPSNLKSLRVSTMLLARIQKQMSIHGIPINLRKKAAVNKSIHLYLKGTSALALEHWKTQLLKGQLDSRKRGTLLHAVIYTCLQQGDLLQPIQIVDAIIQQAATVNNQDPSAVITLNGADLSIVKTLARFMAMYFTNSPLFVHPPHRPLKIASPWQRRKSGTRCIPLTHDQISTVIRTQNLSSIWSVEKVMDYLLISGLLNEAVWLTYHIRDLKAAFVLAVSCVEHSTLTSHAKSETWLPEELQPGAIIKKLLTSYLPWLDCDCKGTVPSNLEDRPNTEQLISTLNNILTAGVVAGVDVLPWMLDSLMHQLKREVSQLSSIVPEQVYLPAPPLYCPQPLVPPQDDWTKDTTKEYELRSAISALVQLVIVVFKASYTALASLSWYMQELNRIQKIAVKGEAKDRKPCTLPEFVCNVQSATTFHNGDTTVNSILCHFRDLCSLSWLLNVRDQLSLCLRKCYHMLDDQDYLQRLVQGKQDYLKLAEWLKACSAALLWAQAMLPFTRFLNDEYSIHCTILSLLVEFKPSVTIANTIAEHFHDSETLDAEIQEKLKIVIKEWKGVAADTSGRALSKSTRGKPLSLYYHTQEQRMNKILKWRSEAFGSYEEFVFIDSTCNGCLHIGSRSFEREEEFLNFLDTFSLISFESVIESDSRQLPLLTSHFWEVRKLELTSLAHKALLALSQKKMSTQELQPLNAHSPRTLTPLHLNEILKTPPSGKMPKPKSGLFRSRIFTDLRKTASTGSLLAVPLSKRFSVSQGHLDVNEANNQRHSPLWLTPDRNHEPQKDSNYAELFKLLQWLTRWAGRYYKSLYISSPQQTSTRTGIHVKLDPHVVVQTLQIIDQVQADKILEATVDSSLDVENQMNVDVNIEHFDSKDRIEQQSLKHIGHKISDIKKYGNENDAVDGDSGKIAYRKHKTLKTDGKLSKVSNKYKKVHIDNDQLEQEQVEYQNKIYPSQKKFISSTEDKADTAVLEKCASILSPSLSTETETRVTPVEPHKLTFSTTTTATKGTHDESDTSSLDISSIPDEELHLLVPEILNESLLRSKQKGSSTVLKAVSADKQIAEVNDEDKSGSKRDMVLHVDDIDSIASREKTSLTVQDIVRAELCKLMEIQHQNTMNLLGGMNSVDPHQTLHKASSDSHPKHFKELSTGIQMHSHDKSLKNGTGSLPNINTKLAQTKDVACGSTPLSKSTRNDGIDAYTNSPRITENVARDEIDSALRELQNLQHIVDTRSSPGKYLKENTSRFGPQILHIPREVHNNNFFQGHTTDLKESSKDKNQKMRNALPNVPFPLLTLHNQQMFKIPVQSQGQGHHPLIPKLFSTTFNQPYQSSSEKLQLLSIPMDNTQKPQLLKLVEEKPTFVVPPNDIIAREQRLHLQRHNFKIKKQLVTEAKENIRNKMSLLSVNPKVLDIKENMHTEASYRVTQHRRRKTKKVGKVPTSSESESKVRSVVGSIPQADKHVMHSSSTQTHQEETPRPSPRHKIVQVTPRENMTVFVESKDEKSTEREVPSSSEDITETIQESSNASPLETEPKLISGYSIEPGTFNEHLPEVVSVDDNTTAALHYLAVSQVNKEKTTEAFTQVDKDERSTLESDKTSDRTTSDLVKEAIEHHRSITSDAILAPDIFMGLQFSEGHIEPGSVVTAKKTVSGRNYINVVDIGPDVLEDIVDNTRTKRTEQFQPRRVRFNEVLHENKQFVEKTNESEELFSDIDEMGSRSDRFTTDILTKDNQKESDLELPSMYSLTRGPRARSKEVIVRQLRDMDAQLKAIDSMTNNMDSDFRNTRLLMKTIDSLTGVVDPESDMILAVKPSQVKYKVTSTRLKEIPTQDEEDGLTLEQRVSEIKQHLGVQDESSSEMSIGELDEKSSMEKTTSNSGHDEGGEHISGLSGLSDIMQDVLEDHETLKKTGITDKDIQQLTGKNRKYHELKDLTISIRESTPLVPTSQSPRSRKRLKLWMEEKRQDRQKEYLNQRNALKGAERRPYVTQNDTFLSAKDLQEFEINREEHKIVREQEFVDKREMQAHALMKDLVDDKVKLPSRHQDVSTRKIMGKTITYKDKDHVKKSTRPSYWPTKTPQKMHNRLSTEEYDPHEMNFEKYLLENQDELSEMLVMEEGHTELNPAPVVRQHEERREEPSYTDLVKLQRPDVTRKEKASSRKVTPYVDRLKTMGRPLPTTASKAKSIKAMQRLFGTKRIPGGRLKPERTTPRIIKTYTERLQEMKAPTSHTPLPARSRIRSPIKDVSNAHPLYSIKGGLHAEREPRKNTVTYTQQLQDIQEKDARHKGHRKTVAVRQKPSIRPYSPPRKTKTYVEQLQQINAEAPKLSHRPAYSPSKSCAQLCHTYETRRQHRIEPYSSPYKENQSEQDSTLSPWSVASDLQKILYGNHRKTSYHGLSEADATDNLDLLLDYADEVDIHALEHAADLISVSSGSVISVIDWDAVDNLIADVH